MTDDLKKFYKELPELTADLISHGFGEIRIVVEEVRNFKIKITVYYGKSFVYFIEKEIKFAKLDKDNFM